MVSRSNALAHPAAVDWHARRPLVVALAIAGFAVSSYLALYQTRVVAGMAWDPISGGGTDAVLHSSFARALPVPDTLLGAVAYLIEAVLASIALRPGSPTPLVVAFGLLGVAMAATGIALVGAQALVVHAWCALCLVSAGISIVVGALALRELAMAVPAIREGRGAHRTSEASASRG